MCASSIIPAIFCLSMAAAPEIFLRVRSGLILNGVFAEGGGKRAPGPWIRGPEAVCLRIGDSYSSTGTGARSVRLSGVTAQSQAHTLTPAAAASRRARPKAGWVSSLGATLRIPSI